MNEVLRVSSTAVFVAEFAGNLHLLKLREEADRRGLVTDLCREGPLGYLVIDKRPIRTHAYPDKS